MTLKRKFLSLALVSVLLLLSACSSTGSSGGSAGNGGSSGGAPQGSGGGESQTISIGALFPFSGGLALLGEESFRGVELAVEQRNQNGGVAGGKKIAIIKGDAVDADAAQAEANRLITKENVNLIVGSYSSSISFAASEVAERNSVLYFELGAVSDAITNRGYKYILRTNAPASYFSKTHINFIKDVVAQKLGKAPGDLRIAIVHEDSTYGTTIAEESEKLAKENGMNIVTVQPYSASSNDLSSVILNLKKASPDVLIAVSYLNDAILLARQSKELGFDVPVFIGSGGGHTMVDFPKAVGELANGIFNVDFPQYQINREFTPGMDEFLKLYREKYGQEPRSGHSLTNYMGMNVVLDLIDQVGEVNPDKIREAAMGYKKEAGTTATGWGVQFDPETGQNTAADPYVHQWIDGELKTVWPENVAVSEPQINK